MSANSTEPDPPLLPPEVSLMLRSDSLMSALVESLMHGMYTVIIGLTIYALVTRSGWRALKRPLALVILLLYALATVHNALHWRSVRQIFVKHGQTENTVLTYMATAPLWGSIVGASAYNISTFIADCIVVWRTWIVWNRKWYVVVLPILTTIAGISTGIWIEIMLSRTQSPSTAPSDATVATATTTQTALNLATTVVCTLMIVLRILTISKAPGNRYRRTIEVIVESAAIYSVAIIVHMPFPYSTTSTNAIPFAVLAQVTGIAPTLIYIRVALGFSRPQSSWAGTGVVETLDFKHGSYSNMGPQTIKEYNNGSATIMIEDDQKTANLRDDGSMKEFPSSPV